MTELLSIYNNKFKDIFEYKKNEYNSIFRAIEEKSNKEVFLKIYDKRLIEDGPKDLILKQIQNEKEITLLCKSENIIELYDVLETSISIIFIYENCDSNLLEYLSENGELMNQESFFIQIVHSLAKALKVLNDNKVIHRDIKPNNIYIKKINNDNFDNQSKNEEKYIIKLADFGSSISQKDNNSMPIGTLLYLSPEIIKNIDYDEKIDLWSLGITLYQLYFGFSPYGIEYNFDLIQDKIYSNSFIYKFSEIPTLDILFKKLLEIEPQKRMTHKEFYSFVFSEEFMKQNIYNKDIYGNIYNEIINIKDSQKYKEIINISLTNDECLKTNETKENLAKITSFLDIFNITEKYKMEKEKQNKNNGYINILYYNEDISHPDGLAKEIKMFEEETKGTFFFIKDKKSLEYIIYEIYNKFICDKRYAFNLIVPGSCCEIVMNSLEEKYKECFNNICIFCIHTEKYLYLKEKYPKITGIYKTKKDVITNFIKKNSDIKYRPFPVISFITYEEYQNKYFNNHRRISLYYGELTIESYKKNYNKIKHLIEKDKNELYQKENILIDAFQAFNLEEDIKKVNVKIIEKYTENTFFGDLNRWLRYLDKYSYEEVAYFTSRFMYSLNQYANQNTKFYNNNNVLYRGIRLNLSSLLSYERAKGKIIIFTGFTSMSLEKEKAMKFARLKYKNKKEISVLFYIKNIYYNPLISNGIDIHDISHYKKEEEILFQPFSFYIIKKVNIDVENQKAEIYLETIGKKEILEMSIQNGKFVKYNEKNKMVESVILT